LCSLKSRRGRAPTGTRTRGFKFGPGTAPTVAAGSRRSETTIRIAVGAQREDVLRLSLRDGLRLGVLGVRPGLIVGLALSAGLKTDLIGVGPADPMTFAAMAAAVLAITLAPCWLPARRAAQTDPLVALRNE
jgi:ABC-type lipoprotein release transport system permease subunit